MRFTEGLVLYPFLDMTSSSESHVCVIYFEICVESSRKNIRRAMGALIFV